MSYNIKLLQRVRFWFFLLICPVLVQAQSAFSSIQVGATVSSGASVLAGAVKTEKKSDLRYEIGTQLEAGLTVIMRINPNWSVTSGVHLTHLRYQYRISRAFAQTEGCLKDGATYFRIHPTYLTLSLQGRRTIVSNRNHSWYVTAGTRIYHRLERGDAVDNRQDLLRCKLALNMDFFYRRNMISIVGGLGYTHHLTSHWLLQLALAGEYGLQSFLSDNRGIILEYFADPHFVSLVPRIEVQYRF